MEEEEIEHDGRERADGHAGGDEGLCPVREGGRDIRLEGDEHGQAEGSGDDSGVAAVREVRLGDGLQADPGDVGKQRERGAAEDRRGDGGDDGAGLGKQAEENHEACGGDGHPARLDASKPHEADVLGEAGVRERVHDTAEDGGYAVSPDGAHDVVAANAFLDDFAGGEDVASGLDHGDNHDDDEGEDGDEVELRNAEVEGRGDAKRVGGGDLGKGGIAQREGDGSAEHEADENRERTQEAAEEALDKDDDGEGAEAVEEVTGGRHAFRVVDEVVGGDRK